MGNDTASESADQVRVLADELIAESAAHARDDIIELRVRSDPRSIRMEVAWTGRPSGVTATQPETFQGHAAAIDRLADRWGGTSDGERRTLWAERSSAG